MSFSAVRQYFDVHKTMNLLNKLFLNRNTHKTRLSIERLTKY